MSTPLLSPLAARRRFRRLMGTAAGLALALATPAAVQAQTVYGLGYATNGNAGFPTGTQLLGSLDVTTGTINLASLKTVSGVTAGQLLVGMDSRPATGELFVLGYDASTAGSNSQLYTLSPATGAVTAVGNAFRLELGGPTDRIGFDFNPTVDRIRVVSSYNPGPNTGPPNTPTNNYRLNPTPGAGGAITVINDGILAYATGTPADPNIGAAAYTNSVPGASTTVLYDIDETNGLLAQQNPPNNGTLATQVPITFNGAPFGTKSAIDIDIYVNPSTGQESAYLIEVTTGGSSNFYNFNLATGAATSVGSANVVPAVAGVEVRDIAAAILPPVTGRLLYGVANGNLISFDSGAPGSIRTTVAITGLPADGSQVLAGVDFRPATGVLFALGYNATTSQGQLYTLNLSTGALAAVGGLNAMMLGTASGIGFDFNPVADRVRIVGANGMNYRLNPANGVLATANDGATGRSLSGTAYTNNDNNANTGTTQYGYDQDNNQLVVFSDPNAGTNTTVGGSGITVVPANGVDFDIYSDLSNAASPMNMAFAVATPNTGTTDVLYSVNLGTGLFTSLGQVGSGLNLSGLAAFLTPGPTIAAGLTWTGAVSTDWGTAGNWSPMQVPTATDNVTIPDVTNDPVVTGNQLANGVTLNTGAVLTLADGSVLSVSGNIVNNSATIAASGTNVTGRITLAGAAAQTISGTLTTFPNLTVGTAGASLGGPVSIRRGLVLNGTFTTASQTLTLLSDATGTAYAVNNAGGSVSGAATVQRYIMPNLNAGPGYRHYSSPVTGNTVSDFTTSGYSPTVNPAYNSSNTPRLVQPYPTVFYYDQSRLATSNSSYAVGEFDNGFLSPGDLSDGLVVGRGYTVNINSSALVDFTGTLNTGPYSRTNLARGAQTSAGYHLLGNPYPGAIDYNTVLGVSSGLESALYVFKSTGQYTGTYTSYVNGASTNTGTNVLPVGQGFFVRTAAGQTGAVNFTNAARLNAPDNTPFQRTAGTRPELTLSLRNATAANQAVVYFEQGATAGFDARFDAHYLPSTNGLLLATEAGAETLAINGQAALTGAEVAVPLQVAVATTGSYTLAVDNLANLPANYHAYLRDALTGNYTDLATTPAVTLNLAANGAAGGRYAVVFTTQNRVLATAPAALARLASVYPNPARTVATLLLPVALRGQQATTVTVVDNVGRAVLTRTLAAGAAETLELPLTGLTPGVYSVLARTASGLVAKRLVVE